MTDLRNAFIAVVLLTALIPTGVLGQSRQSTQVPDEFEFFEGHAYAGADRVNWKDERLVFVKRVADMNGKGSFHETIERLEPTAEAWERFWARIRWVFGNGNRITTRFKTRLARWRVMGFDSATWSKATEIERL
jgi:hypothetical protein